MHEKAKFISFLHSFVFKQSADILSNVIFCHWQEELRSNLGGYLDG